MASDDVVISALIRVVEDHGYPVIELRRRVQEPVLVKAVLSAAFREQAIVLLPRFSDKVRSVASLCEKGLIYKEGDNYYFTF